MTYSEPLVVLGTQMNCPVCKSKDTRRSRRQYTADYMFSIIGVYPWRCRKCETRFHARMMTLSELVHAHCPICGNPDLKRIAAEHVNNHFSFVWRWLSIPAYPCEPCRHKYFSIRPCQAKERELAGVTSSD
jgi:C4-type Zn-finger protein